MKTKKRLLLFSILIFLTNCAQPTSLVEEYSETEADAPATAGQESSTIIVTSASDEGPGSLRQALEDAQIGDTVIFDTLIFPPDAPAVIMVSNELPHLRASNFTIDASNAGVILDGSQIEGDWVAGLQLVAAEGSKIMGLQISHFPGPGIAISGNAARNVVGGDRGIGSGPFGQGNMLSQNMIGLDFAGSGTTENIITGNLIGTNADGAGGVGNKRSGILLAEGANGNVIGPENVIAFNMECGVGFNDVYAETWENRISGNTIENNGDTGICFSEEESRQAVELCTDCAEENLQETATQVIFHNGNIITMDIGGFVAEAIAVEDGIITAVGSNQTILAMANEDYLMIDLQGRTVMPAFIDTHTHVFNNNDLNYSGNQDLVVSHGIGTVGAMSVTKDEIEGLQLLDEEVGMKVRTNIYMTQITNCGEKLDEWYLEYPPSEDKSEMLRISGVKIFTDGGSCNAPARSIPPLGDLYFSQNELNEILLKINKQGYQAAIHALGDRAVEQTLKAIGNASQQTPYDMRNRIEHTALVRDDMLGLHDQSGAIGIIFGDFPACYFGGDASKFGGRTPEEYIHWEWRWRELMEANPNTIFAWHTDYKLFDINPFVNLYGFVVRKEIRKDGSVCEPPDWAAANRISVEEALRIMTINSAYAMFMDDVTGSLEVGKFADLIVISENPLTTDHEDLDDIQVLMTMVGGRRVYCASDSSEFCP